MPSVFIKTSFKNIRFKCQRCGTCCHHKRPSEFDELIPSDRLKEFWEKSNLIYLTEEDIRNISRETGRDPSYFVDTLFEYDGKIVHVDESNKNIILDFPVMKSKLDTTCVFYENGCTIYSVRPIACRLFPFRVEEQTTPDGDIILNIAGNASCPGVGKGKMADRALLERLVFNQFQQRSESVASEVRFLRDAGRIFCDARIYRSHPGRKVQSK